MLASNSLTSEPYTTIKLDDDMETAQGRYALKGSVGPCCHSSVPDARNSVVPDGIPSPPIMYTPTFLRVATAWLPLVRSSGPITFSSQRPAVAFNTRQEESQSLSLPPQVASIGLTPAVMKLTCRPLVAGRGGRKQPLMGGYVSVEDRNVTHPCFPPVSISLSSLESTWS